MIFVDSIEDLDYYNTPAQSPGCYCEQLVYASDLLLQASFNNSTPAPTVVIDIYSADGLTLYETATSYFEYYFFYYQGLYYCNIRLKSYSPAMCQYKCWILRVRIGNFFDKYTNRYCQTTCCDTPKGVTFTNDIGDTPRLTRESQIIPLGDCHNPLIRIEVEFPCLDKQLGDYYGIPTNVYSGSATFGFKKITNITGKIRQKPREITRQISYNCTLQRSESFKPFLVQSIAAGGVFPLWKLNELEAMFHGEHIVISDFITTNTYQFSGGTIATEIYKCWDLFRLNVTVQSCTVRQTFGCDESCDPLRTLSFIIPESFSGGLFYSESGTLIGNYSALLEWYRGQNLVTNVTDTSGDCDDVFASFTVTGNGYIPTYFYYDNTYPRNRVFGTNNPVCPVFSCAQPVIGAITTEDMVCDTPTIGAIITSGIEDQTAEIVSIGNWGVRDLSIVNISDGYGKMYLETVNEGVVETSPMTYFVNEPIGVIEPNGRPLQVQTFTNATSPAVPVGSQLTIDTLGKIIYTGYPTSYDMSGAVITIPDLYYILT